MIKKIKSEIVASIKNRKINVFILFLLSAFVILILTKLSKDYTNTVAFSVLKTNVPQENAIVNDSNTLLNITLKMHGFKWLKYYFKKPSITIDFEKDVYKRDSVFMWSKTTSYLKNTQFDKQVELLNMSPDTLLFEYDINLIKTVPVVLHSDIKFSAGFDTSGTMELKPDSIQVIGPKVIVSKITHVDTDNIVLTDTRADINEELKLSLPENKSKVKFSTESVTINAKVEKFTEGTLKVPVSIINVPSGKRVKYFPKTVNVSFYVSLSNFSSIETKDFKVECDYNKVSNGTFLPPELTVFPETVKNVKMSHKRIEFIISE